MGWRKWAYPGERASMPTLKKEEVGLPWGKEEVGLPWKDKVVLPLRTRKWAYPGEEGSGPTLAN